MPSLLSCFCVHHRSDTFPSRKKHRRKKILRNTSDLISETSYDLYHRPPQAYSPERTSLQDKQDDEDILSRLIENQASPRRPHVQDIFRQEPPEIEQIPDIHSLRYISEGPVERMNGYVPKTVGEMSASTALTGAKLDDFFSDCRLHPALSRFAKSSDFDASSEEYYTIDRHETRPSVVKVGATGDRMYQTSPSHLHIQIEAEDSHFDDVMRGSVSSASVSPVPSDDEKASSSQPSDKDFFFHDDFITPRNSTIFDPSLEKMFHSDGDVLY